MNYAPITITRVANMITIRPISYSPILIPHLTWNRQVKDMKRQWSNPGEKKSYYTTEYEPLFKKTDHEIITFAGFRMKVYDLLKQYAPVEYIDKRDANWLFPRPRIENLGAFRHGQLDSMQKVWTSDGGVISCSTGWGKSEVIAKICASYKDVDNYPIIVVAPGLDIVDTLIKRLSSYGMDPGQVDGSHNKRRQITVCSASSLAKMESDGSLQKARLCLFDEVHKCPAPTIRQSLIRMNNARMFGLSATVEGRSDKGEIVIEALFGRKLCDITYQEAVASNTVVPMHVLMMDTEGQEMTVSDPTSKTRHGIWRNASRNNAFAFIASQLVEMGQVLILTQTLEHAVNIYKLLPPGWQMVYATHPDTTMKNRQREFEKANTGGGAAFPNKPAALRRAEKMSAEFGAMGLMPMNNKRRSQLAEQFASGKIRGVIATATWSTGVDFPELQFVIRVDGSAGEIFSTQGSGRGSRKNEGKTVGIVIDGEDRFDPSLDRRKQARIRTYKKHGWPVTRNVRPEEIASMCQRILNG